MRQPRHTCCRCFIVRRRSVFSSASYTSDVYGCILITLKTSKTRLHVVSFLWRAYDCSWLDLFEDWPALDYDITSYPPFPTEVHYRANCSDRTCTSLCGLYSQPENFGLCVFVRFLSISCQCSVKFACFHFIIDLATFFDKHLYKSCQYLDTCIPTHETQRWIKMA